MPARDESPAHDMGRRLKKFTKYFFRTLIWLFVAAALPVGVMNIYYQKKIYYDARQAPRSQAAIVLGASVLPDKNPSQILTSRIDSAITLYQGMKVGKILLSGHHTDPYYDEVGAMKKYILENSKIPKKEIMEDDFGLRTLDSIYRAKRVYGLEKVTVVTQRYHLPRTLFLANAAGLEAFGFAADKQGDIPIKLYLREYMAQILAMIDVWILDTQPKYENREEALLD